MCLFLFFCTWLCVFVVFGVAFSDLSHLRLVPPHVFGQRLVLLPYVSSSLFRSARQPFFLKQHLLASSSQTPLSSTSGAMSSRRVYDGPQGPWEMQLLGGRWYARACPDGADPGEWASVEDTYLNQPWCIWHGTWQVFDLDTQVRGLDNIRTAFYLLAFEILPQWDGMLARGDYSRCTIKGWSYHGAARTLGDVGNRCMQLTVELVHLVRELVQESQLWEILRRNQEHVADQLEAIMGLRELYPANWGHAGDIVDTACCATYNVWFSLSHVYNAVPVAAELHLEHVVSRRKEVQQVHAQAHAQRLRDFIYPALYRKLKGRRSVLRIIVCFLDRFVP